jgi:ABC-2 type transport system permease protein
VRALWIITASDLRQRVRDRSVLIFGLLVPLGLMGMFNLLLGGYDEEAALEPVTVAVSVPAGDRLGAVVPQALGQVDAMKVSVETAPADRVRDLAATGKADLAVVVPTGFGRSLTTGEPATVRLVEGDGAGIETDILVSVVQGVVDQLAAGAVAAGAGAIAGLPPEQLREIGERAATAGPPITLAAGEASDEQLTQQGTLVAGQTGLFLFFTVSFGVLALLAERELGTMPRLLSMPLRPMTVVGAKALAGFLLGLVTTTMLLSIGALMFDLDFGSLPAVAVLVLGAVTAATSLTFVVARLARTAEQASVIQSIVAMVLGMAGGAFIPIQATGAAGVLLEMNPVAALIHGLGITSGGGGLGDIGGPMAIMLVFAVVCLGVSRVLPDRGSSA